MNKLEHWQNAGEDVSHGWFTAQEIKQGNRATAALLGAPLRNKIILNMAGVEALHAWLGELIASESGCGR